MTTHYHRAYDPFAQLEPELDHFFDVPSNQLRIRELQLSVDDNGLRYRIDAHGFKPKELNVDVEGDQLVVSAGHKEENNGTSVHRSFVHRVAIPKNIQKEALKCALDESGRLVITAPIIDQFESQKRSIPIEFKNNTKDEAK